MIELTCPVCAKVFWEKNKRRITAYRLGHNVLCSKVCRRELNRIKCAEYHKKNPRPEKVIDTPKPKNMHNLTTVPRVSWVPYAGVGAMDFPALLNPF